MKEVALSALLLISMTVTTRSQERPPQLLVQAVQCLQVKQFLPRSKSTKLAFGYFLDEKSYTGDKVIYIVNYTTATRSKGLVFAVFLTEHNGGREFNIQNNASFILSRNDASEVSFANPPLGGMWTQEHLSFAVKEIEKRPQFAITVKKLSSVDGAASCMAYTDPQRKREK